MRCPNRGFCPQQPSAVPFGGGVLVVAGRVSAVCRWWRCNALWCVVHDVMWMAERCHVMSCHVVWCGVMSCHLMWCDFLRGVMSRDATRCHVIRCALMWRAVICCEVMRRNGMGPYELVMRCGLCVCISVLLLDDFLRIDCRFRNNFSFPFPLLTSVHTTLYYKVLRQYDKVLSSTALYYKVPVSTTKYYSSTTPYYKVLLQYYSVLENKVLL